jgi:AcrR family transcriptional regulator
VPKDTFFNLPESKRALICDVALDEFAQYPYDQASVNRIVAGAGIAKGSFYQYFEDKKDLFLYLTSLIAEEKINYLSPLILNPDGHDVFTVIREMFLAGVQFANEHPRYAAIGNKMLADKESSIYRELQTESRPTSFAVFEPLLKQAIARGEVRDDSDIKMLNYIIASMNDAIVEYCLELHPEAVYETMGKSVDAFIDILKNGIGAQMVHTTG